MKFKPVNPNQWELVPFKDFPMHDSIWSLARGADGNIYIGLSREHTPGGIAQLYGYDVKRRVLKHCLDVGRVTGEPADSGHATQCKIHFAIAPAADGKIYCATHCSSPPWRHKIWSAYGMWGDPSHNFPGGHIFRYDLRTGESVDFGVIFPNEGIPYLLLDEKRKRLYGLTYPRAHFFRTDLAGRNLVDYGRISSWYPLAMAFDQAGNLFTSDSNSRLIKYDVEQDRLVFYRSTPYAHPWNRSKRYSWISNLNMAEDGKMYGTHYCNDHLFRFDPREKEPRFEDLGPALPGAPFTRVRCLVPDQRGHLYYIGYPHPAGPDRSIEGVFIRHTLKSGRKEALGALKVKGTEINSWIGTLDQAGRIYMAGWGYPIQMAIYTPNL